jgi:hypothetical protein
VPWSTGKVNTLSLFAHWCAEYAKQIRETRLMLMLQGYADDSGSDGSRPPFVLAGFVDKTEKWESFSDDWKQQLDRKPKIDYFKMAEAASGHGQFEGWDEEFIRCKIIDLLSVLEWHQPDGIYSWIKWDDYRHLVEPHVHGLLRDPYQVLFPAIFDVLINFQRRKGIFPETTDMDFDEQGEAGEFARQIYPKMKARIPAEYASVFGRTPLMLDDKKYLPLQAADMLAWNMRRELDQNDAQKNWHWLYERIEKLVRLSWHVKPASLEYLTGLIA